MRGANIINYHNFTVLNVCMNAKRVADIAGAVCGGKGGLWWFGGAIEGMGRQKGDFVALCNGLDKAVALVKAALQAAFAADGHGEHAIKGLAGEPRRRVFVDEPCEQRRELAVAVVFPCVQQGGDGGGVFGARPKGGVRRGMALAAAAQGLVKAELAAAWAKVLRIGEQLAQFALAGGAERVGLGGVADKAALDVGEHGGIGW